MSSVYTKTFNSPPLDRGEILRYASVKEHLPQVEKLINECLLEVEEKLSYKVCYAHFPISFCENAIDLSFVKVKSKSIEDILSKCHSIVLFSATIGIELDRMIFKYGKISPTKALILQAIGAERIESLCDEFSLFIESEYGCTTPRFSPGYGDLPIDFQKDIFRVLEPSRKIGLSLNESMLMTPSKSVTAIIGISNNSEKSKKLSCNQCNKTECSFRRTI